MKNQTVKEQCHVSHHYHYNVTDSYFFDSEENIEGVQLGAKMSSDPSDLLSKIPRYCCPIASFLVYKSSYCFITRINSEQKRLAIPKVTPRKLLCTSRRQITDVMTFAKIHCGLYFYFCSFFNKLQSSKDRFHKNGF